MLIELIYTEDCPHVAAARHALRSVLDDLSLDLAWFEIDLDAREVPSYARGYASPTVMLDGQDVEGAKPHVGGVACKLTFDEGRLRARLRSRLEGAARS